MLLVVETAVLYYCEENKWFARTFAIDNFLSFPFLGICWCSEWLLSAWQ